MGPDDVKYPFAYCDGVATFFAPSTKPEPTYFGGPPSTPLLGIRGPVHHILRTRNLVFPLLEKSDIYTLPLFYGIRYSGCTLEYELREDGKWKVTRIEPRKPSSDWPYPDYPPLLPYIPLGISKRVSMTSKQVSNLTWQGIEVKLATLMVVVPPMSLFGVSMWGPSGDDEGVQIVFECDLERKAVRASAQCT